MKPRGVNIFIITDNEMKMDLKTLIERLAQPEFALEIKKLMRTYIKDDDNEKTGKDYKVN